MKKNLKYLSLSDFKKAGGQGVTFTGGEVTVYEDF